MAPKVTFATKIFHPNITTTGSVGLQIILLKWSAATTISKILNTLIKALEHPSTDRDEIANVEASQMAKEEFREQAVKWTQEFGK